MTIQPVFEQEIKQHAIWKSLVLHLIPGVLILAFVAIAVPILKNLSLPLRFGLLMGIFFILIPFELGVLFYEGKKRNGTFSLNGIVVYREKISIKQYLLWVPLLLSWSVAIFLLSSPFQVYLSKTVFSWVPAWFIVSDVGYSKTILIVMVILYGIGNVAAAIVEELYFRGYLLPRLSRLKGWAQLVNAVLFAMQHFMAPWQQLIIIFAILPQVYVVSKKRNIFLGIIAHSLLNLLSSVSLALSIFG